MKFSTRLYTILLKSHFSLLHLRHILKRSAGDVVFGHDFVSSTLDPAYCRLEGSLKIGNYVQLRRGVSLSLARGGEMEIRDHTRIGLLCSLNCRRKITIGKHVMIAEFSTVCDHDGETGSDPAKPDALPVSIGDDVWIGAGCAILKGTVIPDGCIIGAHSVVLQKSQLVPYGIYAGRPVRLIRMR